LQSNNIICQLSNHKACQTSNVNNQNNTSVIYQWCDKQGHSANKCWKKQNDQRNVENKTKMICQICNNFGHDTKNYRSKLKQSTASKDSLFRYCKEQEHLLENCELRTVSNNRRKINSQGNSNESSKSGVQQGSGRITHPSTSQKTQ